MLLCNVRFNISTILTFKKNCYKTTKFHYFTIQACIQYYYQNPKLYALVNNKLTKIMSTSN
jgi:hypothetical protein